VHDDAVQHERCVMLFARILRQAFDDLIALSNGDTVINDDGRRMPAVERAAVLAEVQRWFFDTSDAPVSLAAVCEVLNLNPGWMRLRAKQILAGSQAIQLRRHRLTAAQRTEICAMLRRGASTATCAKRYNVDPSTCRKTRIREKRNANIAAGVS
jgi:hypothetical protein